MTLFPPIKMIFACFAVAALGKRPRAAERVLWIGDKNQLGSPKNMKKRNESLTN
jgi:hypothetical protein